MVLRCFCFVRDYLTFPHFTMRNWNLTPDLLILHFISNIFLILNSFMRCGIVILRSHQHFNGSHKNIRKERSHAEQRVILNQIGLLTLGKVSRWGRIHTHAVKASYLNHSSGRMLLWLWAGWWSEGDWCMCVMFHVEWLEWSTGHETMIPEQSGPCALSVTIAYHYLNILNLSKDLLLPIM